MINHNGTHLLDGKIEITLSTGEKIIVDEWVWIKGYEGLYQINTQQQIRSLCRKNPIFLSKHISAHGYWCFPVNRNNKQRVLKVGRQTAISFIPNPNNYETVNHINGNKLDDRIVNLEWCTNAENVKHAYRMGLVPPPNQEKNKKPCAKQDMLGNVIDMFESIESASVKTSIPRCRIRHCLNHSEATSRGFKWVFVSKSEYIDFSKNN